MGLPVSSRVRTGSLGAATQGEAAATTPLVCLSAWTCSASATPCTRRTKAKEYRTEKGRALGYG